MSNLNITSRAVFKAQMMSLVIEYIDEAEHQEGQSYLRDNFTTDKEVYADFILYVQNKYDLGPTYFTINQSIIQDPKT